MGSSPELDGDVVQYLERVVPAKRQRDARTMVTLMARATGQPPRLRGTIVGFGSYHYRYASGREGDAAAAGFAARKNALSVYVTDGVDAHADLLERLGPHRAGVSCIYLKDLADNDLTVLEQIIARSYATLTAGPYGLRARDGGRG